MLTTKCDVLQLKRRWQSELFNKGFSLAYAFLTAIAVKGCVLGWSELGVVEKIISVLVAFVSFVLGVRRFTKISYTGIECKASLFDRDGKIYIDVVDDKNLHTRYYFGVDDLGIFEVEPMMYEEVGSGINKTKCAVTIGALFCVLGTNALGFNKPEVERYKTLRFVVGEKEAHEWYGVLKNLNATHNQWEEIVTVDISEHNESLGGDEQ